MTARRLLAAVLALGCSRASDPPFCDGVSGAVVTREAEHAGAGHEVTVRLRFSDGVPIAESDLIRCLSVESAAQTAPAAVAPRPVTAGYTLLLIDPGALRRDGDFARSLVTELVSRRPAGEQFAVYRWGADVTQVVPFGSSRQLLADRLAVGMPSADTLAPAASALATAAAVLSSVGGSSQDALKTMVLVSPRATALQQVNDALPMADPHLLLWIGGDQNAAGPLPRGLGFPVPNNTVPGLVVAGLSARLDAYQRYAHYAIGVCGGDGEGSAAIHFGSAPVTGVSLPAPMVENRGGTCHAEDLAAGRRDFPRRIELLFSPSDRAAADAAFADRVGRPAFPLSVRVAPGAAPTTATARYRGDDAYDCRRRSYTVALDGDEPRYLFPGFASNQFHLVAMCLDRMYLRTFTVLSMMAAEGLFPVPFDMVEVVVDGASQGPYIAIEDVAGSLRVHSSRVTSVLRRDATIAGDTAPEVMYAATSAAAAVASYGRLLDLPAALGGSQLEQVLRDRLDYDGYLSWMALMNVLGSGGYADEIFFYAVETTAADGQRADYHLMMGWDEDHPFDECAGTGRGALVDPFGLLRCSQAELDRRIFSDPLVYSRYVERLMGLVARQTPDAFGRYLDATVDRLLVYFADPQALAGLVELGQQSPEATTNFDLARRLLFQEQLLLQSQFEAHRSALLRGLALYRGPM